MTDQSADKLLKAKQELNEQKQEFTSFAHQIMNDGEVEVGQEVSQDRIPDEQNRMKSTENRRD